MRRVFILGAGASISASDGRFPSIDTIFKCAKELGVHENLPSEEIGKLVAYSKHKFGWSCFDGRHKLDIEKMLTLLDIESGASLDYLAVKETVLSLIRNVIVELESGGELATEFVQFKREK